MSGPQSEPVRMTGSEHFVAVGETAWPVLLGDIEWTCRCAASEVVQHRLLIASALGAYMHLTDPAISQKDAIAGLKRARTAEAAARGYAGTASTPSNRKGPSPC